MPNWLTSMLRTYEYFVVDPNSWRDVRQIPNVKSCSIERDSEADTLGSASIDTSEMLGECYVRAYLITIQNGIRERHPLATFLVQTPVFEFDGKAPNTTADGYTPLLELKEKNMPLGFSVLKGENVMDAAYRITRERVRAPVVKPSCDTKLYKDFVANLDDTGLTFVSDFIANAKHELALDEMGRVLFAPVQDLASLQPVWTYNDDNSSILLPEISIKSDLFGIPNVVEVVYSDAKHIYYARAVNDDPNSPTSTVNRGREIPHRVTDPSSLGDPTEGQLQEYAENLLKQMSTVVCTITYTHGYCPVRLGDCVRINYSRTGFEDIKAKVISQSIKCTNDCLVTETAQFTKQLWR